MKTVILLAIILSFTLAINTRLKFAVTTPQAVRKGAVCTFEASATAAEELANTCRASAVVKKGRNGMMGMMGRVPVSLRVKQLANSLRAATKKYAVTKKVMALTFAAAKAAGVVTDYAGFDADDTIYIDPESATLEYIAVSILQEDISENTTVSFTIDSICSNSSKFGEYEASIEDGSELIELSPLAVTKEGVDTDGASAMAAFLMVLVLALII